MHTQYSSHTLERLALAISLTAHGRLGFCVFADQKHQRLEEASQRASPGTCEVISHLNRRPQASTRRLPERVLLIWLLMRHSNILQVDDAIELSP